MYVINIQLRIRIPYPPHVEEDPFRVCPSVGMMFDVVCNRWGFAYSMLSIPSVFRLRSRSSVGPPVDPHVRPFDYSAVSTPFHQSQKRS